MNGHISETDGTFHCVAGVTGNDIQCVERHKHITHRRWDDSVGLADDMTADINTNLHSPGQIEDEDILEIGVSS